MAGRVKQMKATYASAVADRRFYTHMMLLVFSSLILARVSSYGRSMIWVVRYFSAAFFFYCVFRVLVTLFRPILLKALFRHQPWATAPHSIKTMMWELAVGMLLPKKGVSGKGPLFAYCLPDLPLPRLGDTLSRRADALRPLLPRTRASACDAAVRALLGEAGGGGGGGGGASSLQSVLDQSVSSHDGWLSPWVQREAARQASNDRGRYYLLDAASLPGEKGAAGFDQASRAACLSCRVLDFINMLRVGRISPKGYPQRFTHQPKVVPRCNGAFKNLFTASFIPRESGYELVERDWEECRGHVVVFRRGSAFRVGIRGDDGGRISDIEMERRLRVVMMVADKVLKSPEKGFEMMSRLPRQEAAAARSAASELIGSSKDTLPALETAALLISLDECTSNDKSEQAGSAVMGDAGSPGSGGSGRWFERAFTLVVGRDCAASLSCVETLAELSCTCQMWEYALASEAYPLSGERMGTEDYAPTKLQWSQDKLASATKASHESFLSDLASIDIRVVDLSAFSRSKLRFPIAPHVFLQLASQVAYGRAHGAACISKAWVPKRLFRLGMGEEVLSMTAKGLALVKAMGTDSMQTLAQQRAALVDAASAFEQIYKDAMLGKGADSHLRALREAALVTGGGQGRMAGHIEELMASRDGDCRLETRVVPVQISAATSTDRVSIGGGFRPSCSDGYGVSFALVGEEHMYCHVIGAAASSETTVDVGEFVRHLISSLRDMHHVAMSIKARRKMAADPDDD